MLTIKNVVFRDEGLTQKLFSGLPVLEKLYLEDCSWEFIKVLSISAPRLHFLSISEIQTENLSYCQIMIFGDCLKEFVYYGHLLIDYCLYNSLSLETADIDLVPCEIISKEISYRVHKLLVGVCNVKYLTLSSEVVQFLGDAPELLPHMPVFNNLLDLAFMESEVVDLSDAGLLRILHNAPCLRTLKFAEGISFNSFWDNDDGVLDSVPPCFMSHLKRINVFRYGGHELNLLAVKILLKNAVTLEKMIITGLKHISGDVEEQTRIRQQLLELPRGSQYCEFVLK
ncbi:hypothetical protein CJ030_MR0G006216 [Morella rubra]|uniref:FBD domain-containing protein n=1 Tax=Morella rubra TaxID=262757 RepID=A0A6A1ULY7_9ROSI|nr:hypothetical protein CJ030_MR0G006216 [Morella rubra]